jgi:thermosome
MPAQQQMQAIPLLVLPQGTQRTKGRDAQKMNILAARTVAEVVRSTLGPKGMDKMLVDTLGDIVITNDGVTILDEMDIEHPTAKMMVEVAKTQQDEIGDGTTTAVIIAGELIKKAEDLLEEKIHPTVIIKGYQMALKKAEEILHSISEDISIKDEERLKQIAITAMTGKSAEGKKEFFAKMAVEAIKLVAEEKDGVIEIDKKNIKIEKKHGGGMTDSELLKGVVIDKEKVHVRMPSYVKNAKIALVDEALEVKKPETDAKINITDPESLDKFLEQEEKMIRDKIESIRKAGANVVICQKGIDDMAQHFLAKYGIYAVRRVKKSDMEKLAKATGGKIVTVIKDLSSEDLGEARVVEEVKIGGDEYTFIRDCVNPKAVTLFIRGGTEHVVDEIEKAVEDAIDDITAALKLGKVVAGGGASEIELTKKLSQYAPTVGGKEQLAIKAFADAINICPRTLAENAGLDPTDQLVKLKTDHESPEKKWYGLDVYSGEITDMWKRGVIEPLALKLQAVKSAGEVAEMILRVDDVVTSKGEKTPTPPAGGPEMGGMGGMPPGGMY